MNRSLHLTAAILGLFLALSPAFAQVQQRTFNLRPEHSVIGCLSAGDGSTPSAQVFVERGELNDILILRAHHLKPNLDFDMFTVQNSNLTSNGTPNPNFKNFGLAWYQSDLHSDSHGEAEVVIKTILFDQIFGFDPAVGLLPTNTFHVGFWFNNPKDAEACGFDITKPTPFNGEHKAGPAAMISIPDPTTGLGPLCASVQHIGSAFVCHP